MTEGDLASSRKRSRSSTPTRHPVLSLPPAAKDEALSDEEERLVRQLRDPAQRTGALNDLLQWSASHERNYALPSDTILKELVDVAVYDCLNWQQAGLVTSLRTPNTNTHDEGSGDNDEHDDPPQFRSKLTWTRPPTQRMITWTKHCQTQLDSRQRKISADHYRMLEVIMMILRNFSYVGANLRLLMYSPNVLALLVGCLYEGCEQSLANSTTESSGGGGSTASTMTLALAAIQTLIHLTPQLDLSGQKLLCDKLFYDPTHSNECPTVPDVTTFGQAARGNWGFGGVWIAKKLDTKEDTLSDADKNFVLSLAADQLASVWSIFSGIANLLVDPKLPRPVILMVLDFLQETINLARVGVVGSVQLDDTDELPTLRAVLVSMPDTILQRLVDFLYIPRLGPDALDYIDPVRNVVTRVTTLKLMMGYDATVDTDVRDRTLDVLVPLLELDTPRLAARLGRDCNGHVRRELFDGVVPILSTTAGRNDASLLASQLLRELSKAPENDIAFQYVQERLVELASRDARIAQLVWNHLYVLSNDAPVESADRSLSVEEDIAES